MLKLITKVQTRVMDIRSRPQDEEGAAMVEYGLLIVGIAVTVGAAAALLGDDIAALFTNLPGLGD